ncbi:MULTISPECIES: restriction endonuclease [Bacteroidota]|uniref:ATPase n=3 Tax=Sphingobacteriaceae TaxID=84566 RepID=A0A081PHH2_9SPHI|nr:MULTISPECIES: restriction endonuclease [Bacteroidota]KEQ30145.1 ATPase [Pedobacter antarcticus 4BY]MBA8986295.1 Holliday junction resolvase-like predicted endonuclease [Sphingobacterium soli]MCA4794487.1 restriction endonuclease [Myroides odoratimimus]MCA4808054.1 restriction endonuclease [Myroides odoratimimus]MCA4821747.1 restriction endonuclease [Myroides odoratimimus]
MQKDKDIYILKASGQRVAFDSNKLRQSLSRSGAAPQQVEIVLQKVQDNLIDGMATRDIYRTAFKWLRKIAKPASARYNLKKAIMALGPTGFPFEKLTSAILESMGYSTRTGVIVPGHCVKHEIDVIATKDDHHIMIECKFHNRQGFVSDVKIPLYIQSRFLDVEKQWQDSGCHGPQFHQSWIVTNGRFSEDAIQYGTCMKMSLVGWDYPRDKGLKDLIDRSGLYPITCLISLTERDKKVLLANDIIVCSTLLQQQEILTRIGLTPAKIREVVNECRMLCEQTK